MEKGKEIMDAFMKMAQKLPQGIELPVSVSFANYQKQVAFFDAVYSAAWQDGVDDATIIHKAKLDNNQN